MVDVFFDHAFRAEARRVGPDTFLDELHPAAGCAIHVPLIEEGNSLLFQYAVELVRIMLVLRLDVLVSG